MFKLIVVLFVFSSFQVFHKFYVSVFEHKSFRGKGGHSNASRIFLDDEIAAKCSKTQNLTLSPSSSELNSRAYVISNFEVLSLQWKLNYLGENLMKM